MQIGLVPSRGERPCQGGTAGEALETNEADRPAPRQFLAPPAAARNGWNCGHDHGQARLLDQAQRVVRAMVGDDLAQTVLPVVGQAGARLRHDLPRAKGSTALASSWAA